jgi:predicted RNase H-like HicB family nuclease
VRYHFRIREDARRLWAECVELEGCVTQGRNAGQLEKNMRDALNLYLEEPPGSSAVFPVPASGPFAADVVEVEVDPKVAFSMLVRQARLQSRMTQREAAERLGMDRLFSYQRLERRSNPSLMTMKRVKMLFPDLSLDLVLGTSPRPHPRRERVPVQGERRAARRGSAP